MVAVGAMELRIRFRLRVASRAFDGAPRAAARPARDARALDALGGGNIVRERCGRWILRVVVDARVRRRGVRRGARRGAIRRSSGRRGRARALFRRVDAGADHGGDRADGCDGDAARGRGAARVGRDVGCRVLEHVRADVDRAAAAPVLRGRGGFFVRGTVEESGAGERDVFGNRGDGDVRGRGGAVGDRVAVFGRDARVWDRGGERVGYFDRGFTHGVWFGGRAAGDLAASGV
mmetsp:Transcript_8317/g.33113  ORF Transcript_8317/g.33113 Transcript_8317/m.33113 type:complete len:234 (-) Transcript_8317:1709-2410(-)